MKKNKSLVIILSIFAFIVLIVILSSTVFCLKSVDLNFMSNTINLTNKEEIIKSGNFKYNQSIFFIKKQQYIKNLEENNPYIKVINIETAFPNKLVVNCIERNELIILKGYQQNAFKDYMVLDNELKVLSTTSSFTNTHENAILVNIEGELTSFVNAGQTLSSLYNNLLKNLSTELLAYNNNPLLLKANFEEITLNFENNGSVKIKMRSGTEIILKDASTRLTEKFMLALSYYNELTNKTKGTIVSYIENNGEVAGYYYE